VEVDPITTNESKGETMGEYCIATVSEAQARFYCLEPVEYPELESGPKLCEVAEISNPEKRMPDREIYTDTKTGRGRAPGKGPAHGYDDHREKRGEESSRKFSRIVLEKIRELALKQDTKTVILAAPPKMLGMLRQEVYLLKREGIGVHEHSKDLTKLSPREIHEHLAKEGLIPALRRPGR